MSDLDVIRADPYNAETPERALAHATTPAANTYVRTNFGVPSLNAGHVIEIGGAVNNPFTLAMSDLASMPQHTIAATMECAGNDRLGMHPLPTGEPWQHGALSTIEWTGVSLRDVLARAGVRHDAVEILVTAADSGTRDDAVGEVRFARALPVRDAMRSEILLATGMNGAPLTPRHGAPVRLAVPGWYGMASVKWVTRIEAITEQFTGYFQRQRYVYELSSGVVPVERMRVKSIITAPMDGARGGRAITVRGWAWSGSGPIVQVMVAVDGGDSWQNASLGSAASAHAWTPWRLELVLPRKGRFVLRSRAMDATGASQPDTIEWNRLGYGNNAVRHVTIIVE